MFRAQMSGTICNNASMLPVGRQTHPTSTGEDRIAQTGNDFPVCNAMGRQKEERTSFFKLC
jgi:hypothetical protein